MLPDMLSGGSVRGRAIVVGGSTGVTDGGFVDEPVASTTASGNTTLKGKTRTGAFGKVVYPLANIAAGRQYTFRYVTHFSQLAQQGKLAMVGFGLKTNNDFHIVGLRGDGSTGLHKYQVNGTPPNGWNAQTGHTTSDGGASANGTQAGPNYIRLVVSADGATYKFQTSPDNVTYTDEYTGQTPAPFSNVSGVTTFGLALWFNNADAGPFSIDIDQFADAAAPSGIAKTWLGFTGQSGTASTFTFNSVDIGAADSNRVLAICCCGGDFASGAASVTGVTVNGIAQTSLFSIGSRGATGIALVEVPAGTSATIIVTFGGSQARCDIGVYRLVGYSATLFGTADAVAANSSATLSMSINVAANGALIGFVNQANSPTIDWTGITEDDQVLSGFYHSVASQDGLAAETGRTITEAAGGSRLAHPHVISLQPR
ncbi:MULTISPECIES: hypothetical protein [unclassified Mesorhizobium]|uniref:hypothetical protein n=1 Tax=unclassified Mesorhizobium TaxID=325217 RepID=UPI0010922FB5|nr:MULTISPECIES: hypothetical protein [unclassified Mesorhizobium]TGQ01409.1 hypothetical protein EN861_01450 [Mesorhizobium sp. M8A.F.Ca.ET.218.01.1.1]TGT20681.1 hypothetical protein EN856_01450 [Mesorhizobium sp. M8A.F.Ca.ET.213.01.1.1]